MKAPFPYFGGKRLIAHEVWARFGDVKSYVEPFFGSGAVLLNRPEDQWRAGRIETVNDISGYIANAWRAIKAAPHEVAQWADWPSNENDLTARHIWLVNRKDELQTRLEGDPEWYDAKVAGWWLWGMACWIGSGFCSSDGPWGSQDGQLVHLGSAGQGVNRQLVHLGSAGQGVNRKRVHLGDAGQGVNRKRVHLGGGRGDPGDGDCGLTAWMEALCERFRGVRVCCGDWARICGPSPTEKLGLTGAFLDPPYSAEAGRDENCYGRTDDLTVAHAVREWALERGDNPLYRIALCGYEGEHTMPESWECLAWKAAGGYGNEGDGAGRVNAHRERIWFSPTCLKSDAKKQRMLFEV